MIGAEKKSVLLIGISLEERAVIEKVLSNLNYEVSPIGSAENVDSEETGFIIIGNDKSTGLTLNSIASGGGKAKPALIIIRDDIQPEADIVNHQVIEYIRVPFTEDELVSRVKSLLKRADIYGRFGTSSDIEKKFASSANKVLIVDDDIYLIKLFAYNLTRAGFEVKTANNGLEGYNAARQFEPDLIVSDIMMPEADGYEFRKLLLEDPDLKSIPFVFLTAKGEEQDILDGYILEIEDYIIKTSGPKVLIAKVSAIIKSHEKERTRIVSEINSAAENLRAKVVPDEFPEFGTFQIRHWHQPYKGVPGGDFIDYFQLNSDTIAVVLGDVMGKKWGAWYFAFAYAGYVRSAIRVILQSATECTPGDLLQKINESIYQDAKVSEVFATISIVILNRKNNIALYSGAGDLPLIVRSTVDGKVDSRRSNGLLLGFSNDGHYENIGIKLLPGDMLALITDGVIESRNEAGEQFGLERFKKLLSDIHSGEDPLVRIKEELEEFTSGNFEDDISLIVMKSGN
ncbi:MAG: SpoIIE family protein phosphatase [Syntrophothermus sp.]